jgi:NAD(P)-dependent dehydrogenase (short-subunit alcohol dehydrogenase family)
VIRLLCFDSTGIGSGAFRKGRKSTTGKLDGKVAIVTGARGLGRAYAKRLAGLGAKVAVASPPADGHPAGLAPRVDISVRLRECGAKARGRESPATNSSITVNASQRPFTVN